MSTQETALTRMLANSPDVPDAVAQAIEMIT
jgi:hypothetical protein